MTFNFHPLVAVVQWLSCVRIFATPWTAAHQTSLSFTNSRSLLKLMSIESVMPSNHLILCRPLLLLPSIFPSIKVFSNESALHIRWPKYWSFSFSIGPSNEYSGLISFKIGFILWFIHGYSITWLIHARLEKEKKKKTNKLVVMFPGTWEFMTFCWSSEWPTFKLTTLLFHLADHLKVLWWLGDIFSELSVYCDQNFILLLVIESVWSFNKWNRYKWSCSGQMGIRDPQSSLWPFTSSSPSLWRPQISLQAWKTVGFKQSWFQISVLSLTNYLSKLLNQV